MRRPNRLILFASWVLQSRAEQPPDAPQQDEAVVSLPEIPWSYRSRRAHAKHLKELILHTLQEAR
jgi:hypothetical protein